MSVESRYYLAGSFGYSINSAELVNVKILKVERSGRVYTDSGVSDPTPGALQFRYDISTGTIYFSITEPFSPHGERIFVLYKT